VSRLRGGKVDEPPAAPDEHTIADWLQLIRAEYHEIPGLHLTKPQVQQLWNLDATMCDRVVEALEAIRFLRRTNTGAYIKADT
jgi:hypothetical protein